MAPTRRLHEGHELITRAELARRTGESPSTLDKLHAARGRNGHPEAIQLDGRLWFDENGWRRWRAEYESERRERCGRVQVSWAELERMTGESRDTLRGWYRHRARNGHPDGEKIGRRRFFDEQLWWRWYDHYRASLREGLSIVERTGHPEDLLAAPEVARLLGYAATTTLTSYISRGQFIEPDEVALTPSGRRHRRWRRRRIWEYAESRSRS